MLAREADQGILLVDGKERRCKELSQSSLSLSSIINSLSISIFKTSARVRRLTAVKIYSPKARGPPTCWSMSVAIAIVYGYSSNKEYAVMRFCLEIEMDMASYRLLCEAEVLLLDIPAQDTAAPMLKHEREQGRGAFLSDFFATTRRCRGSQPTISR